MTRLDRAQRAAIGASLGEHLIGPVRLDLWTGEDAACAPCADTLALARQIAALHPGISLTHYPAVRHAARQAEAGVRRLPTTLLRARGRVVHVEGRWDGELLPALLDGLVFLAAGATPLAPDSQAALAGLAMELDVELLLAARDAYSPGLLRMAIALAAQSTQVHVRATEVTAFPDVVAAHAVDALPVLLTAGHAFVGAWQEVDLVEQLRRIAAGDDTPVTRAAAPNTPLALAVAEPTTPDPGAPGG